VEDTSTISAIYAAHATEEALAEFLEGIGKKVDSACDAAVTLPNALIDRIPLHATTEDITKRLEEIARIAAHNLSGPERDDVLLRFQRRFPKSKRAYAKIFNLAAGDETQKIQEKTREEDRSRAQDPNAAILMPKTIVEDALGSYQRENLDGSLTRVSTFAFIPTRLIVPDDGGAEQYAVRIIDQSCNTIVQDTIVPNEVFGSKRAMAAWCTKLAKGMCWQGTDDDGMALKEYLDLRSDGLPRVAGTKKLGYHLTPAGPRHVVPAGTLAPEGWMERPDLILMKQDTALENKLPRKQHDLKVIAPMAREALIALPKMHERIAIALLASWHAATAFKPLFMDKLHGFPLLAVDAGSGSGKTTLTSSVLWPMFSGIEETGLMSATQTSFAMVRDLSAATSLGPIYDECKPHDIKNIDAFLSSARSAFNGGIVSRGRADQGVNTFTLTSYFIMMGEQRMNQDAAVAERCLYVRLTRAWILAHPEVAKMLFEMDGRIDYTAIGTHFRWWTLSLDPSTLFDAARDSLDSWAAALPADTTISPRTRVTLTAVAFGAGLLKAYAESLGAGAEFVLPTDRELFDGALREMFEAEDGTMRTGSRSQLDMFIEDAAHLATIGVLREGQEYAWIDGKLFLDIRAIEEARQRRAKELGAPYTSPGHRELRRLAREARQTVIDTNVPHYVMTANHRAAMEGDRFPRGILVDADRLPPGATGDSFPMGSNRTHGGARPPLHLVKKP